MIYVLITTHPSTRFPEKNALLARYTLDWSAAAALYCNEEVKIVHAGPEPPDWLPPKVQHINVPGSNHAADVRLAEKMLNPDDDDVLVLAQLTQPIRHVSLLQQTADMVRATRQTVITASLQPDQSWRVTAPDGTWGKKNEGCVFLHDGTLYAWLPGQSDAIFDRTAKHAGIHTGCRWALVDIDAPGDIPASLPTLWANALHDKP